MYQIICRFNEADFIVDMFGNIEDSLRIFAASVRIGVNLGSGVEILALDFQIQRGRSTKTPSLKTKTDCWVQKKSPHSVHPKSRLCDTIIGPSYIDK